MSSDTLTLPHLSHPIFKKRQTQLRLDQGYGIGRTALINSWKITTPGIKARININGIMITPPDEKDQYFSMPKLRQMLREILPFTPEDNELVRVDSAVYSSQLLATEHYRYFPVKFLFDLIFTGELCIVFVFDENVPEKIDIEEEYVLSESQLLHQLNQKKTVEEIENQNDDEKSF